ncbi:MAG TPA: PilZ domain-containing protein [Myxococcota bacterium]|nr:PilZ domain-containing protein [Myxococcota bacterium]
MMVYRSLLDAFESLEKSEPGKAIGNGDPGRRREVHREIEQVLFQRRASGGAERREHLRVPVSLSARYWTSSELRDRYVPTMGEGGLFIATDEPLAVGSSIDLQIRLVERGLSLDLRGRVAWAGTGADSGRRGMGVEFVELTYDQKATIYELVNDSLRAHLLERRQYTRLDSRLPATFIYDEGSFELPTTDLGPGGLYVETDHLIQKGERVKIVLEIPGEATPLRSVARVVRVNDRHLPDMPPGIGLRFLMTNSAGKQAILDHMLRRVANTEPARSSASGGLRMRRSARLKRRVKVSYNDGNNDSASFTRDISSRGVFVHAYEPPSPGTKLGLEIEHPVSRQVLKLRGRVVRTVPCPAGKLSLSAGAAVLFDECSQRQRSMLRRFLKEFILMEGNSSPPPA